MTNTKTCPDCKQVKSFDDFHTQTRRADGKATYCKDCFRVRIYASRKKNPDAKNRAIAKWRANNAQKVIADKKAWRQANKEKINAQKREWNKNNKDKVHQMNQRSYEKNPALFVMNAQKRYAKFKGVEQRLVTRFDYLKMYRKPCIYCGKFDRIEIDHIQPIEKNGRHAIGNLAPACLPCNRSKSDLFVMQWRIREMKKLGQ
jgi:hypothetical protein